MDYSKAILNFFFYLISLLLYLFIKFYFTILLQLNKIQVKKNGGMDNPKPNIFYYTFQMQVSLGN